MQTTLATTALLMGLAGGPHCIAMCGAACAGIGQAAGPHKNLALWTFQVGRIFGYSMLGALAAASMQGLGWLTIQSAALRPVWSLFHVAAVLLGLVLLINGRQPVWLEDWGRRVWRRVRQFTQKWGRGAPLMLGVSWALLPCGLLYSALLVAAMAGGVADGAGVMALFALGTSVSLLTGPWLMLKLNSMGGNAASGAWGVRLAGLALAGSSAWGAVHGAGAQHGTLVRYGLATRLSGDNPAP